MKTKFNAKVPVSIYEGEQVDPNDLVHIELEFDLVYEDWELFKDSRDFMNEHMKRNDDYGEHMKALITWAIHQSYEQRTGKPFVLRMDRKKNKA